MIIGVELYHAGKDEPTELRYVQLQPTVVPPVTIAQPSVPTLIDAILARPLFANDRRPKPTPTITFAIKTPQFGRLAGILVSPEGRRLIFAGEGNPAKAIIVKEGEPVGADMVLSISAEQATLLGPNGTRVIRPSSAESEHTAIRPNEAMEARPPPSQQFGSRVAKHVQ